jgi:hypothetical protein
MGWNSGLKKFGGKLLENAEKIAFMRRFIDAQIPGAAT